MCFVILTKEYTPKNFSMCFVILTKENNQRQSDGLHVYISLNIKLTLTLSLSLQLKGTLQGQSFACACRPLTNCRAAPKVANLQAARWLVNGRQAQAKGCPYRVPVVLRYALHWLYIKLVLNTHSYKCSRNILQFSF